MNTFPTLNTGAITQYPAQAGSTFSSQVLQFVDGSEQRFPGYAAPVQRWSVKLELLDEDEVTTLAEFFSNVSGPAGSFSFTDPGTGTVYPNCSFEDDECSVQIQPGDLGSITFSIVENRS